MTLYTMYPSKTMVGNGRLAIDKHQHQTAVFVVDEKIFSLARVNLITVFPEGMILSGFEDAGMDRKKRPRYYYQEWRLEFDESVASDTSGGQCG